jgi:sarcosine oxidase subunit gamma
LSGACPLDLDLAEFPVGMCTRTVLAKADIVLWRTQENRFHLEVWRSFSGYVTGLLGEIALEFYPEQ